MKKILTLTLALLFAFSLAAQAFAAESAATGFGGTVSVRVTVEDGALKDVQIAGDGETPAVGGEAMAQLRQRMLEAGSVDVDGVSGATVTSTAVLAAAKAAYEEAVGGAADAQIKMKPGTYTAYGNGYSLSKPIEVAVTVSEDQIVDIQVNNDVLGLSQETKSILNSAIDLMTPRIIASQSVAVDSITGATASSAGIKLAVLDALKQALAAAGSDEAAVAAFLKTPEKQPQGKQTLNYKVLVVGMGCSGTTAAARAAESMREAGEEVSVLAIDKAGKYGGSSAVSLCTMGVNPPKYQAEHNNGEAYMDAELMKESWMAYTEGDAKKEMVDLLIDSNGKVMDWLVYDHGFAFLEPMAGFTPEDIYRCMYIYDSNGEADNNPYISRYFDQLVDDYERLGGQYMLETEAYDLLYDEAANRVLGVKARGWDGTEYEIYADSVILATGGFAGNGELETKLLSDEYYPLKGAWEQYGMKQNDGKMISAALAIGAGTCNAGVAPEVHNSGAKVTFTDYPLNEFTAEQLADMRVAVMGPTPSGVWSEGDLPRDMISYDSTLAVDANGRRFASESTLAMLNSWIAGPWYYSLWTDADIRALETEGFQDNAYNYKSQLLGYGSPIPNRVPLTHTGEIMNRLLDMGEAYKADTIEELAVLMGCDPAVLSETVSAYNAACEAGEDKVFGKEAAYLKPLNDGPYYAVKGYSFCYSTIAALDVNENLNVVKTDGATPIDGLYAIGHDAMGVLLTEKKAYVTYGGVSAGWAYTSGYLAGENAVLDALSK